MRRQFEVTETDHEFLDTLGAPWETIVEKGVHWVLIHEFKIPTGYNHTQAMLGLRIEDGYPATQIDMAYFFPVLARSDGKKINNLSSQDIDGKKFQRWSRHRTQVNCWREGVDDVSTHVSLVKHWLRREFDRR